jgi:DNA topoisomerase-1
MADIEAIDPDPIESARVAGLLYVTDEGPGIRRCRAGESFTYISPDGEPFQDPKRLQQIQSLRIPPAWTNVWICPLECGHLQATGRDAKHRKQYRYHPLWDEIRGQTKYHRMVIFGEALPCIRETVEHDLNRRGLVRERLLATVVRLLEATMIRVGNEEYARQNNHFGLTTMRNRHVDVEGSTIRFHFVGKSGVKQDVQVQDPRLARIVKRCREIPGHHLFEYIDDQGHVRPVGSGDVNDYLKAISGHDFTAKDFRTWAGTLLAVQALWETGPWQSETQAKNNIVHAIDRVRERLGNTRAVCRKFYVHPAVLEAYLEGKLPSPCSDPEPDGSCPGLSPLETAVLAFLKSREAVPSAETAGRGQDQQPDPARLPSVESRLRRHAVPARGRTRATSSSSSGPIFVPVQ